MKALTITILSFLILFKVYGQNKRLIIDKKRDDIWISQLINFKNKEDDKAAKTDSSLEIKWFEGKVTYSPDSCLRFGQILGKFIISGDSIYSVAVQGLYQNKLVDLKMSTDSSFYDYRDYPISRITALYSPGDTSYLVFSTKSNWQLAPVSNIWNASGSNKNSATYPKSNNIYDVASLLRVVKDSIADISFSDPDSTDMESSPLIISGTSVYADTVIKFAGKTSPRPFLKYNPVENTISFLTARCGSDNNQESNPETGCALPYVSVYTGTFKYAGSRFVLIADSGYYYPSLETFKKVLAVRKYKTGNYITKVVATRKLEEIQDGVIPVLNVDYYINSQTIGYVDNINGEGVDVRNLKPNYKALSDTALVFLINDITSPHHSGMCGGCEYDDSYFVLVTPHSKRVLFSFSWSSERLYTSYSFNNGKSDKEGIFYLKNNINDGDTSQEAAMDKSYWKNNFTYVFRVADDEYYRNFYLRFVMVNNKTLAKLSAGSLQHQKTHKR